MSNSPQYSLLAIRRPGICSMCERELAIGEQALWSRSERRLICVRCSPAPAPPDPEDQAGSSAQREHQRRRAARERQARRTLGPLGVAISRVIGEPQSIKAWEQGARGEVHTGERLAKHLRDHDVLLLHDRRVPGHGRANIDHIAVGPAGVLVIDTKTHRGKVRTERVGGLFEARRTRLVINGRDQTRLIDGVERQVGYVRVALETLPGEPTVQVRGALCFPTTDGLPLRAQLTVREIVIDGPKPIARLARDAGPLDHDAIKAIWHRLGQAFPRA